MGGLAGKRTLITGGAGGIGTATAARFLEESARVVVLDRDDAALARVQCELLALSGAIRADVSDASDVARAFGELDDLMGGLDEKAPGIGWFNEYTSRVIFYPKPNDLLVKTKDGAIVDVARYRIRPGVPSDLGEIPTPYFRANKGEDIKDYNTGGWISAQTLAGYLNDAEFKPDKMQILTNDMLFVKEPRVGIGRDRDRQSRLPRFAHSLLS